MIDAQRAGTAAAVGSQPRGRDAWPWLAAVGIGLGVLVHALLAPAHRAACDRLDARAPRRRPPGPPAREPAPQITAARSERAPVRAQLAARPHGRDRVPRLPLHQACPLEGRALAARRARAAGGGAPGARGRQRQPARHAGQRARGGPPWGLPAGVAWHWLMASHAQLAPSGARTTSSCAPTDGATSSTPRPCT